MERGYLRRYVDDFLDEALPSVAALMITGPRACGKSTTALRRAASALHLDEPHDAALLREQLDTYIETLTPPVVIDEWQEVPESIGAVKRAVDQRKDFRPFLITGSVRSRLMRSKTWPGTGRFLPVRMHSMAQGEIRSSDRASTFLQRLTAGETRPGPMQDAPTLFDYLNMAEAGGFPEALTLSPSLRQGWFDGYVEQLVDRDVEDLALIRDPQMLSRLLEVCALNIASTPTKQKLIQAVGGDAKTMDKYLNLLEELGVIERITPWWSNRLKRLTKLPKLHITDTGLALSLARTDSDALKRDTDLRGRIVESFVAAQIRPLLGIGLTDARLHHLRDDSGRREIDLLLELRGGGLLCFEVKTAHTPLRRDARHLEWFRDHVGDQFKAGVILHTGNMTHQLADRIWAMPIASIWS